MKILKIRKDKPLRHSDMNDYSWTLTYEDEGKVKKISVSGDDFHRICKRS